MTPLTTDTVTLWIDAPAHRLYELVADVTRTPEWSPEITRCEWLDGANGPAVGARFKAWNSVSGLRWTNKPVVEVADPGREFAFSRTEPMGGTLRWRYQFTPTEGGTTVEESYEVTRPIGRSLYLLFRLTGGQRAADMRRGMQTTLARLKTAAEDSRAPDIGRGARAKPRAHDATAIVERCWSQRCGVLRSRSCVCSHYRTASWGSKSLTCRNRPRVRSSGLLQPFRQPTSQLVRPTRRRKTSLNSLRVVEPTTFVGRHLSLLQPSGLLVFTLLRRSGSGSA